MNTIFYISIITTHIFASQIQISNDEIPRGLELIRLNSAYIHEHTKYLFYTYQLTSIQRLFTWNRVMTNNCYKDLKKLSALDIEIEHNIKWNIQKPEPDIKAEKITRINETLYLDRILSAVMDKFDQNIDNCQTIDTLTKSFILMNRELNNLAKLDITELGKIILLEKTVDMVNSMLEEKYVLPYTLNYTNTADFLTYSKFNYYYNNYTITLSFEIPMYTKSVTF